MTVVPVVRREQAVRLSAYVCHAHQHILRELAFDRKVVLVGILLFHVWLEFSEKQDGPEIGPIDWLVGRLTDDADERIGSNSAGLILERKVEQCAGKRGASAERRLGAELLHDQFFDRIIKNSVSHADTEIARAAGQLGEPTVCPAGTPG